MTLNARGRPVVAIAGLGIESSTFSPARTEAPAFRARRGADAFSRYPFLAAGSPLESSAEWHGALVGSALPGGIVTSRAFAELSDELLDRLGRLGELDGLYFDIHGAMTVEGLDDAEAVLLDRIRAVVGSRTIVSTSMDLHGNVSRRLVHQSDLITCHRTAPHEDAVDTRERAVRNLVDVLARGGRRPTKAWIPVPILLPGEKTSTRIEPARSLYARVAESAALSGILDAAIWVGYAWADEPRNRAGVVVTGDDADAVTAAAEHLAESFWAHRRGFAFVAPTGSLDECLDAALACDRHPFVISDSGDNPTAGGAGDVTWGLMRVLARPEFAGAGGATAIYASLPAPDAIRAAVHAGLGATVTVTAGAEVDHEHAGPVTMTGTVHAILAGDPDAGTEVVLRVGGVRVILTERRKPYHHLRDFTALDLDPAATDVVIVKIGYLEPELFDLAADWMLALTPGGVDQDLLRLGHRRIHRPMFPFDPEMGDPDLSARIIPPSIEPLNGGDE